MNELAPMQPLFDVAEGQVLPLPTELEHLYGRLRFPSHPDRPHVVGNFVTTLDGVVSLGLPGMADGRPISGANEHDRLVMGLLRAVADAVVVGAGTFRESSKRRWTAEYAFPPFADAYRLLRERLGKPGPPLDVIVTARGDLDFDRPSPRPVEAPALVITTEEGALTLHRRSLPPAVQVVEAGSGSLSARQILDVIGRVWPSSLILVEAGPRLMADFVAEQCLDELFLTLAPQIAGRDGAVARPGMVAGRTFAPDDPRWGSLVSLKRAESHLFLRYAFAPGGGER
jgi:riboflavin biosynthesis pyrimidine reductase